MAQNDHGQSLRNRIELSVPVSSVETMRAYVVRKGWTLDPEAPFEMYRPPLGDDDPRKGISFGLGAAFHNALVAAVKIEIEGNV